MNYESGERILLGDTVRFDSGPNQYVSAKVVMLGEDFSHLKLEQKLLDWVVADKVLDSEGVVVEVASEAGRYMFTTICCVELIQRLSAGSEGT